MGPELRRVVINVLRRDLRSLGRRIEGLGRDDGRPQAEKIRLLISLETAAHYTRQSLESLAGVAQRKSGRLVSDRSGVRLPPPALNSSGSGVNGSTPHRGGAGSSPAHEDSTRVRDEVPAGSHKPGSAVQLGGPQPLDRWTRFFGRRIQTGPRFAPRTG